MKSQAESAGACRDVRYEPIVRGMCVRMPWWLALLVAGCSLEVQNVVFRTSVGGGNDGFLKQLLP